MVRLFQANRDPIYSAQAECCMSHHLVGMAWTAYDGHHATSMCSEAFPYSVCVHDRYVTHMQAGLSPLTRCYKRLRDLRKRQASAIRCVYLPKEMKIMKIGSLHLRAKDSHIRKRPGMQLI